MPRVTTDIRGNVKTIFNAIEETTTSSEIQLSGHNVVMVSCDITGTGTWKVDIKGRLDSAGTVMDLYDNNDNQLTTGNITADRMKLFLVVPELITIVATEVAAGATLTVRIQPMNV
jgi:hypothetical protein